MPNAASKYFGSMEFQVSDLFCFPSGIPGFEEEREFIAISIPGQEPLMYLQSVREPDFCLITLPARACHGDYRLELSDSERASLRLADSSEIEIGVDVACQAILTLNENSEPTANLAAPLVMNLSNRLGLQSFQLESGYSFEHAISSPEAACPEAVASCS